MKAFQNIITNVVNAFTESGKTQFFPVVQQHIDSDGDLNITVTLFSKFDSKLQTAYPESGHSDERGCVYFRSNSKANTQSVYFDISEKTYVKESNFKNVATVMTDAIQLLSVINDTKELMTVFSELASSQSQTTAIKNKIAKAEKKLAQNCVKLNETEAKKFMTNAVNKLKRMRSSEDSRNTEHHCDFALIEILENGKTMPRSLRISQRQRTSYSCDHSRIEKDEIAELFSKCWIALNKVTYTTI